MAIRIVEPQNLQCAWCQAPKEALIFARSHSTPRGNQVICSEVYHCRKCGCQTGIVRAEPLYTAAVGRG